MKQHKLVQQITALGFAMILLVGCGTTISARPTLIPSTLTPTLSFTPPPTPTVPTVTLTNTPQRTSTPDPKARNFATYYGVWTITRYEHPEMSVFLTDEYAESQIGKKMELSATEMRFDNDFLWSSTKYCANASYDWATPDDFMGHGWQALLHSDNPEKRDDLLFLDVNCDGEEIAGFEVSRTGKLVIYYDSYWFFLDSETTAVSALSTRFAVTFTPSFTATPTPLVWPTSTATLAPTQFYEEYFFDWLIAQEVDADWRNIVQAGSNLLFTSEEYPDTPDSFMDLDNSVYTEGKNDLKLSFVKDNPPDYQLLPINGTKVIPVDFSHASLETCMHASYFSALDFISIEKEKGNYFCAVTSDKRFSLFHIDEVNHLADGSLRLSFVTHKKDTDE